jgi:hypothetical protein
MVTVGVLYITTGKKYIKAAVRSAETVRKFSPDLPIHLFADYRIHGFEFDKIPDPFTSVEEIEHPHRRSKLDYMSRTPYDRTLYLDTDTALATDIRSIYQVLDRFDIALCHAHVRNNEVRLRPWNVTIPDAFPQFNSGVILYKNNPETIKLMEAWPSAYQEAGFPQDQTTLRELLWLSDLRIATLPPEYNLRFMKYHFLWSKRETVTKIYHLRRFHSGRFWFLKQTAKRILRPFYYFLRDQLVKTNDR